MPDSPEQVIRKLALDDARRYVDMLERLAMHMSDRINYAEGRRASLATNAAALLAAGIAILAIVKDAGIVQTPLTVMSLGLVLTGLASLVLYALQTNAKTFLQVASVTRPWKWFYRDALKDSGGLSVGQYTFQSEQDRAAAGKAFDEQWPEFAKRFLTLADPAVDGDQNLRQVYLLHANEMYKNQHLSELRNVFNVGAIASVVAFLVVFAGLGLHNLAAPSSVHTPSAHSPRPSVPVTPNVTPRPPSP